MYTPLHRLLRLFVFVFFYASTSHAQNEHDFSQQADAVARIILSHALRQDIDALGCDYVVGPTRVKGYAQLKEKLLAFVKDSKPLVFTLVGFPFKSRNTKKNVLGPLPDQGERAALEGLHAFMGDISRVYPPGAKVQIYTDGLAFCDVIGVSHRTVACYEHALKLLAADLSSVSIITLQDLHPGLSFDQIQNRIKEQPVSEPLDKTQQEILEKRLLREFDDPEGRTFLKRASLARTAQEMHRRSQQINALYKKTFPESIALSVHYQHDIGKKIGVSLLTGVLTPWHGTAVLRQDGSFEIRRRCDIGDTHVLTSHTINGIDCSFYKKS